MLTHRPLKHVSAEVGELLCFQFPAQLALCGTCASRHTEGFITRHRARLFAANDLDDITILKGGAHVSRHAIDLGAVAAISNRRMDRIGEIERHGACGEQDQSTFRRKGEDVCAVHLHLRVFEEIIRISAVRQ